MELELPIEIDVFLMNLGFFKKEDLPDFEPYRFKPRKKDVMFVCTTPARRRNNRHADVFIPERKKEEYVAWKPTFEGEEPPF